MHRRVILGIVVGGWALVSVEAQPAAPPKARFEVASVKRNQARSIFMGVRQLSRGRLVTENTPLSFLVAVAYKRREGWFEIAGAPPWMESDGYDVEAKAAGDATNEQMYPMLQALLADRFHLTLRRETRELPVYNLVPAKGGLKLPNAKEATCFAGPPGSEPAPVAGKRLVLPCGFIAMSLASAGLQLKGGETSMGRLASILSGALGRTVVDRTGFPGTFDIDVEFTPDDMIAGIPGRGLPGSLPTPPPTGDRAGPSLFVALQEKLGLKLEAAKGPVPVFVVEHVERPSPN